MFALHAFFVSYFGAVTLDRGWLEQFMTVHEYSTRFFLFFRVRYLSAFLALSLVRMRIGTFARFIPCKSWTSFHACWDTSVANDVFFASAFWTIPPRTANASVASKFFCRYEVVAISGEMYYSWKKKTCKSHSTVPTVLM